MDVIIFSAAGGPNLHKFHGTAHRFIKWPVIQERNRIVLGSVFWIGTAQRLLCDGDNIMESVN